MNIEQIFLDCGPNQLGQVKTSCLMQWISANLETNMNFRFYDRTLEDFQKLLDPEGTDNLVTQEHFEICMKTWLSSHVTCLLQEDSIVRDSSGNSDKMLNFSSGTLETSNHSFAGDGDIFATCCCHEENELRLKNDELERKVRMLSSKIRDLQHMITNLGEENAEVADAYKGCKDDLEKSEARVQRLMWLQAECDRLKEEVEAKELLCLSLENELLDFKQKLYNKDQQLRDCMFSKDDTFSEVEALKTELQAADEKIAFQAVLLKQVDDENKVLTEANVENINKIKELEKKLEVQAVVLKDIKKQRDDSYTKLPVEYRSLIQAVENIGETLDPSVGSIGDSECSSEVYGALTQNLPEKFSHSLYNEMKCIEIEKDDKETQCDFVASDDPQDSKLFETSVVFVETTARRLSPIHLTFPVPRGGGVDEAWARRDAPDGNEQTPRRTLRSRACLASLVTSTPIPPDQAEPMDQSASPRPSLADRECAAFADSAEGLAGRLVSAATMTDEVEKRSTGCQVSPSRPEVRPRQRNRRQQSVRTQTDVCAVQPKSVCSKSMQTETVVSCLPRKRVRSSQDLEPESEKCQNKIDRSAQTELLAANLSFVESDKWLDGSVISGSTASEVLVGERAVTDVHSTCNGDDLRLRTSLKCVPLACEPPCARWNPPDVAEAEAMDCGSMVQFPLRDLKIMSEGEEEARHPTAIEKDGSTSAMWDRAASTVSWTTDRLGACLWADRRLCTSALRCGLVLALLLSCLLCACVVLAPDHAQSCSCCSIATCLCPEFKVNHFGEHPI
ncbi:uncharacterized protein LOC134534808 isoform X2 [Bacillus rossius redtenbacheri]|uniref:uncharacterized protein LOC134534808 isoform X2 n=1 Tax=Bacillus rossius redtenbacheri TaxID=93214 RepID=UPI002FDCB0C9